jgi:hypothetical protein
VEGQTHDSRRYSDPSGRHSHHHRSEKFLEPCPALREATEGNQTTMQSDGTMIDSFLSKRVYLLDDSTRD